MIARRVKVKKLFGGLQTDYLDGFQYKYTYAWEDETGTTMNDEMKLRIIPTSEGYFDALRNRYFYNYTDHLGNVRLSYSDADGNGIVTGDIVVNNCYDTPDGQVCNNYIITGEAEGVTNYYPFGLMHNNESHSFDQAYQYKYQGQELQETGFYSFKWRNYMPDVGRFFNVDPLSEKYMYQSHYNFAENKVIAFRELEGLEGIHHTQVDQNGKKIHTLEKNLIVLTNKTQEIPILSSSPTKEEMRVRDKIIRQNERIESANQARINYAKEDVSNYFSGAHQNSAGETVTLKINISEMKVNDTSAKDGIIDGTPLTTIAWRNGIESEIVKADGKNVRSPASIWTTVYTSSTGKAQVLGPMIYEINNQDPSIGNFSHELGHTFGLDHPNGGINADGLMHYPPDPLTPTQIDTMLKEAYPAKK
ncbi:MAG: hypothetical protein P0Y62_05375 [Candidatus Chryseobacterium colombiense]|nr:RHS repeat-associated core domain-containing protein [Chryseobacterium sp.]WEK70987.1 MAG: hypothetical protein P0Y62_05375 [Chryseobacterium sp.]